MSRLPEQPTWRMFVALLAAFFVLAFAGGIAVNGLGQNVSDNSENVQSVREVQRRILATQDRNQEVGFAIQALDCSSLVALGAPLPEDLCLTPDVLAYYDPERIQQTTAGIEQLKFFAVRLCELLDRSGDKPTECAQFEEESENPLP